MRKADKLGVMWPNQATERAYSMLRKRAPDATCVRALVPGFKAWLMAHAMAEPGAGVRGALTEAAMRASMRECDWDMLAQIVEKEAKRRHGA